MGQSRTYSIDNVVCTIDGIPITEFIDGDAIEVVLDGQDWTATQGSHGAVVRSGAHNNLATCTLRIMQGSPANQILSARATLDALTKLGAFGFEVRDTLGTELCVAPRAWIEKRPDLTFATEAGSREWVIKLAHPTFNVGTSIPA